MGRLGVFPFLREFYPPVKRAVDILVSGLALIGLAVPLLLIWIAVKVTSKGPGIFWSDRVGRNGEIFEIRRLKNFYEFYLEAPSHGVDAETLEGCGLPSLMPRLQPSFFGHSFCP